MKISISKERFNQILQEEVQKYQKIKDLESERNEVEGVLQKIQEAKSQEEIDELWGGFKNLFNKGAKNVSQAASSNYNNAKNTLSQTWDDAKTSVNNKVNQIGDYVNKTADSIKTTYQQGEKEQAVKDAKQQIQKLWMQRQKIQQQLSAMQNKYAELTGKKLGNQFQSKNPQTPVQNRAAE